MFFRFSNASLPVPEVPTSGTHLGHDERQRDEPDGEDHQFGARRGRLELEREADGVPALHADAGQGQHRDTHRDTLQERHGQSERT